MQSPEGTKRQIESTKDLQSVIKTMKAMAAVSISHYESAVESLEEYYESIEMGFRVLLNHRKIQLDENVRTRSGKIGAVVFGSDQGMCGQFNNEIYEKAVTEIREFIDNDAEVRILCAGYRIVPYIESAGLEVHDIISMPSSVEAIVSSVRDVLLIVDEWQSKGFAEIYLYYNDKHSGSTYEPTSLRLIPVDMSIIETSTRGDWPSRCIPIFRADFETMLSHLLKQYLFTSLYRAIAESLASENASRLASMQAAEKNVEERLGELKSQYNHRRQSAITSELLDMVGGYEALKDDDDSDETDDNEAGE